MSSVPTIAPASNAAPAPNVRLVFPSTEKIKFPAVLTDELFEQWLDAHPDRRKSHERHDAKWKAEERARVARMYALHGCDFTVEILKAKRLALDLSKQLENVTQLYGPQEAKRVLIAAGLPLPHPHDITQGYDGEAFVESHHACKKLVRRLEKFFFAIEELQYLMPNCDEEEDEFEMTEGGAA